LNIQLAQSSRKIAEESRRDNLLNIEIAKATAQVAEETRQDSAAMKTIAVLTLTFLPATAVASFFSMNTFNWFPGPGEVLCSPYIWIFFVVTIPLTLLVYAAWIWWFKISQKHYQTRHEKGLEEIEEKLRFAIRSATGTW
jgi:Mg2+ and Co2+ transporter CorA